MKCYIYFSTILLLILLSNLAVKNLLSMDDELSFVIAARQGDIDTFRNLIRRGVNINAQIYRFPQSGNALTQAAITGQKEILEILLEQENIKINAEDLLHAYFRAALNTNYNVIVFFFKHPKTQLDKKYLNLILSNYLFHSFNISNFALNLFRKKITEETLNQMLINSIQVNNKSLASILILKYDVNVNYKLNNGNTVLMRACQLNQLGIVILLLEHKNLNLLERNLYGKTAIDISNELGHSDITNVLILELLFKAIYLNKNTD